MKYRIGIMFAALSLLPWLLVPAAAAAQPATCDDTGMNQAGFVPAGLIPGGTPVFTAGDVWVLGTDKADRIDVTWTGPGDVTIDASFLDAPVSFTGVISGVGAGGAQGDVLVGGCKGADHITFNDLPLMGTLNPDNKAWGDAGNDHITGGDLGALTALNLFFGGDGNDHLTGGIVSGSQASNWFEGGNGNDHLIAGDVVAGELARNRLLGQAGNDHLTSGDDTDIGLPFGMFVIPDTPSLVDGGVGGNDKCVFGTFTDAVECEH